MSAPYDHDVAVVGGGPAGLAAAIRLRWVKGYDPFPASVVVLEPGELGGLAGWGSCTLTGPSWTLEGRELVERLRRDVTALRIPVLPFAARSLAEVDGCFEVVHGGGVVRVLAVVLAMGLRELSNERSRFPQQVVIAMKGRGHLPQLLRRAARTAAGRGLLVVGSEHTGLLAEPLASCTGESGGLTLVLERGDPADLPEPLRGCALRGRLRTLAGDGRLEAVEVEMVGGERRWIEAGAVFLDYHALEVAPVATIAGLAELEVVTRADGFVEIDAFGATRRPGIFAAGDVTGRYAATLTALGDGVAAGFSAYRWVHHRKLGIEPELFAYRGSARPVPAVPARAPTLPGNAVPVLLGSEDGARHALARVLGEPLAAELLARLLDGGHAGRQRQALDDLSVALGVPLARLSAAVSAAARAREMTVHVVYDGPRSTAPSPSPPPASPSA